MTYLSDDQSVHDGAPIELYKFEGPTSAFDFFYTSYHEDVEFEGDTYTAIPIERAAIEGSTHNDPPELSIRLPASAPIAQEYAFKTPPRSLSLTIYRMHVPADGGDPPLWNGFPKPGEIYLPGIPASGNVVGSLAGTVLTPSATPLYQQIFGVPASDSATFDFNSSDAFDASGNTVHDFDDVTFAILLVGSSAQDPDFNWDIMGKREIGGSNYGYELLQLGSGDDRLSLRLDGPNGLVWLNSGIIPNDGTPYAALFGISEAEAECYLNSTLGAAVSAAKSGCGSVTNTAIFSLGQNFVQASDCDIAAVLIWSGVDAETVLATRSKLPSWWAWASTVSQWLTAHELGDPIPYWKGEITGIGVSEGIASFRSPSFIEDPLHTTLPSVTFQGVCNHVLYDDNCKLNAVGYKSSPTVVSITGDEIVVSSIFGASDQDYKSGEIVRPLDGDRRLILSQIGTTLILNKAFRDLAVTDTVDIYPGCPHTVDVCRDKFYNVVNYGGHPYIPNVNPFLRGFRAGGS